MEIAEIPAKQFQVSGLTNLTAVGNLLKTVRTLFPLPYMIHMVSIEPICMGARPVMGYMRRMAGFDFHSLFSPRSRSSDSQLPSEVGLLTALRTMDLSSNQISTLPVEFGSLVNLEVLVLAYNSLVVMPTCLSRLTKLLELDLSGCTMTMVDQGEFFWAEMEHALDKMTRL